MMIHYLVVSDPDAETRLFRLLEELRQLLAEWVNLFYAGVSS